MPSPKKKSAASKEDGSKVLNDVAKPGETPASPSSRPTIVGHNAMIKKDPMVTGDEKDKTDGTKSADLGRIEPLSKQEDIEPKDLEDASTEEVPDADEQTEKEIAGGTEEKEGTKGTAVPSSSGAVDALADEITTKKEDQKAAEEAARASEEIEKIIRSRKYFVPIGEAHRRRTNLLALLILAVILMMIGVNLAVDAEMIDIGVSALTDLL